MDRNLQQLNKKTTLKITQQTSCLSDVDCYVSDPLPIIEEQLKSIDFRENGLTTKAKDQGACGSCWSFTSIAVLENAILRDSEQLKSRRPYWYFDSSNLSLSEQFLMVDDVHDSYCNGGTTQLAWNNIWNMNQNNGGWTVEFQSNFPYEFQEYEEYWKKVQIQPKISHENYYLPFKYFENPFSPVNDMFSVPVVQLYRNYTVAASKSILSTVRSYLSRGIAIATSIDGACSSDIFFYTGGGVLHCPCLYGPNLTSDNDHAVTIVGYGKKNGINVWVVKNSWGEHWGDNGFFFVDSGVDSYCIEHDFTTVIPLYMDVYSGLYTQGTLNRGQSWSLDPDFVQAATKSNIGLIVGCSLGGVAAAVLITVVIIAIVKKKQKINFETEPLIEK